MSGSSSPPQQSVWEIIMPICVSVVLKMLDIFSYDDGPFAILFCEVLVQLFCQVLVCLFLINV